MNQKSKQLISILLPLTDIHEADEEIYYANVEKKLLLISVIDFLDNH